MVVVALEVALVVALEVDSPFNSDYHVSYIFHQLSWWHFFTQVIMFLIHILSEETMDDADFKRNSKF